MSRRGCVRDLFLAWGWAAILVAGVAADAVLGRWVVLPLLVAGFYGGMVVVELLARPLFGRWRALYLVGAGGLWAATAAALGATSPVWLGWSLWFPSPFLRTVGAILLFLSVGATRGVVRNELFRSRGSKEQLRHLKSPPRDAGVEILLGTALLTLNWGMLLLGGVYLLWRATRSCPKRSAQGGGSPGASIIIPTLNEEGNIAPLLSDIARQTRRAYEVIVVDGGSTDHTASVVGKFPGVRLLEGFPPVSKQRNLGGRGAAGDVVLFLDADVRLDETFLEEFLGRFEERELGVACSFYMPPRSSTVPIKAVYVLCNTLFAFLENLLPSGSGQCLAVRSEIFRDNDGFDTSLKVAEDMEVIRRLGRVYKFGIIPRSVRVSDRRFEEHGVLRMGAVLVVMAFIFTVGRFKWANRIEYEFGNHER